MATQTSHFRKTMPAFAAALGMTFVIALCILAFGVNALFNRNTVPVQAAAPSGAAALVSQDTAQQLQEQITQFQAREAQYKTQLQQAADQINQLSQQNQQYQNLVTYLQNAGLIQVAPDGRIYFNRNSSGGAGEGGG